MNLTIVYTTGFNTVDTVLAYLRKKGCNPVSMEKPFPSVGGISEPSSGFIRDFVSPLVYIAVPSEQEVLARAALSEFRLPSYERIATICGTLLFQVAVASLVTLAVAVLLIIGDPLGVYFPVLYAVWLGVFIFVAHLSWADRMLKRQRIWRMWRRPPVI
jgi:hypothetical protein